MFYFIASIKRCSNIGRKVETKPNSANLSSPSPTDRHTAVNLPALQKPGHGLGKSQFEFLKLPKKPSMIQTSSFSAKTGQIAFDLPPQFQQTRALHKEPIRKILKQGRHAPGDAVQAPSKVHWLEGTVFHEKKPLTKTVRSTSNHAPSTTVELVRLQAQATETAHYASQAKERAGFAVETQTRAESRFYIANEAVVQAKQTLQNLLRSPAVSEDGEKNVALNEAVSAVTRANDLEEEWHSAQRASAKLLKNASAAQMAADDADTALKRAQ